MSQKVSFKVDLDVLKKIMTKSQMELFGSNTKVQKPGSRGGSFWIDDKGKTRYGQRPSGNKVKKENLSQSKDDVSKITDGLNLDDKDDVKKLKLSKVDKWILQGFHMGTPGVHSEKLFPEEHANEMKSIDKLIKMGLLKMKNDILVLSEDGGDVTKTLWGIGSSKYRE